MMDSDRLTDISIEKEMKKSYLDYAMSVIIGRALPDVRDGLKPVHRRILFAMHELKNDWNKAYKKSARIVGDCIGKYHPHGDTAVYDTIVRMAQHFSLRYPMVDGQGNFGSVDGDPPAAMRYTEIRMTRITHQIMEDLEKETVEFTPNYDESLSEPTVLPSMIPSLLINGSSGIAVGMATNIPPHNLSEVISGIKAMIDNPDIELKDLIQLIPGPDFPTAGIIHGTAGIHSAYKTGRGIIRVRAKTGIEEEKKKGGETIVVTELPYQVNKARLVEKIATLMKHKDIEGIRYIRDESDREGMRIAMGVKRDHNAEVVINQLYKHTQMENSFGIIFLAVVNNRPKVLSLKELLTHFIAHRKEIIIRRTKFDLKKAEEKAHILEGLKIALDNLDAVVAMIRSSKNSAEAKEKLVENFGLTQIQAQAILDMRLHRLTGLEREKIIEEYESILKDIAKYKEILGSDYLVFEIVKSELDTIQAEFGDERRTKIMEASREITIEDMITQEDMVVTVSKTGYIKRTPLTVYQNQRRGGKGKTGMTTREEDFVEHLFVASTHDTFLFFTNMGKVYWCKVYQIPQAGRTAQGKALVNHLNLDKNEKVTAVLDVKAFEPGHNIMMATRNGLVKKTDLMAFSRPRVNGIIAIGLRPGDELISAKITDGQMNIFLGSAQGKAIRFKESDIRSTGRTAIGVFGMRLAKNDRIMGMEVLGEDQTLFTATVNGFGKRTSVDEYPTQRRGGKGVITIKTSERNGLVISIILVKADEDLMLITDTGRIIRMPISSINVISRNTQGVKLMGLSNGEQVVGAAKLAEGEENEEGEEHDQDDGNGEDASAEAEGSGENESEESSQDSQVEEQGEVEESVHDLENKSEDRKEKSGDQKDESEQEPE
ncbi:DNA gyrase subunit A [Desulfobacterales bacterium HSG16]|nr:DNA gyrase subunit A [Desulfobacterales bacterium HSG16]